MFKLALVFFLIFQHANRDTVLGSIHGRVVDTANRPIQGVDVEVMGLIDPYATYTAYTDEKGEFDIKSAIPGRYRFYLKKEDLGVPSQRSLIFEQSGDVYPEAQVGTSSNLTNVTLLLPKPYGTLILHIVDSDSGKPIAKTRVLLQRSEQPSILYESGATPDGDLVVHLPRRPIRITISAPSYQTWRYQTSTGNPNLILEPNTAVPMTVKLARLP